MAKTITGSTNSSKWTFKLVATEGDYDIAKNASPLTVAIYIGRYSSSGSYMQGADISGTVACTGCKSLSFSYKNANRVDIAAGGWLKIATVKFSAVPHNADGSKTVTVSASFSQSGVTPSSGNAKGNVVLTNIPRQATLTSAPDFTDEENPTIYYSNPAGDAVSIKACISLTGSHDDVIYRDLDPNGTSYTFKMDEIIERDSKTGHEILREATTSGKQDRLVTFFVTTIIGTETYYSTLQRTYTVINCAPDLNPEVVDMSDLAYELTNDRSRIIRYFNNPRVTFNPEPKKGASIVNKTVTCSGQTISSESDYADFENVESNIFVVSVTDNRGITVSKEVTIDMIPYVKLTCIPTIDKELGADGTTANVHITVSGNVFAGSFGSVNNRFTLEYRYKNSTSEYPIDENGDEVWTVISNAATDTPYEFTTTIENLDYKGTYTIQVRAKDSVYTGGVQAKDEIVKIIPVFDWSETDFNFNVPVIIQGKMYDKNRILWSGDYPMDGTQTIPLSEPISEQVHGIVLVFSYCDNGTTKDHSFNTFLLSKEQIALFPNCGHTFLMSINAGFSALGSKYLLFTDTTITGHSGNVSSGTNSGISFDNTKYVLRYVIGV